MKWNTGVWMIAALLAGCVPQARGYGYADAGLYRAPGGAKILQSQFTQGSLLAKAAHRTDKREIDIGILAARGTDIGKPATTASTKPTWYPRENQNLVQLHWKEKAVGKDGEILFQAFVNPNFLETLTDTYDGFLTKESFAKTDSTEFGVQASYSKKIAPTLRLEGGPSPGLAHERLHDALPGKVHHPVAGGTHEQRTVGGLLRDRFRHIVDTRLARLRHEIRPSVAICDPSLRHEPQKR